MNEVWMSPDGRRWEYPRDADQELMAIIRDWFGRNGYLRLDDADGEPAMEPDMLDVVLAMNVHDWREEGLGGGLYGLIAEGPNGTVVVTDDGDAVLIGFYPGDNWATGEDRGNVMTDAPVDDAAQLAGYLREALERLGRA